MTKPIPFSIDDEPTLITATPFALPRLLEGFAAEQVKAERATFNALLSAAEDVVWFDWSDSDDDASRAIDRLREACAAIRAKEEAP